MMLNQAQETEQAKVTLEDEDVETIDRVVHSCIWEIITFR